MEPETLTALAARIGRTRGTVWRWITEGIGVGGVRVKLRATRIGGQWVVSPIQWQRFQADCNPDEKPMAEAPTAAKRRAASARKLAIELTGGKAC